MVPTKRRARTRPASKPLKTETVRMRISATQKQALTAAAERDGLQLSAWLRQLALRAAGMLPDAK
ncbi:MAG: plasmid mobilization protein [Bryobacteraceae bacterium]